MTSAPGRAYARALFELAAERGAVEAVEQELRAVRKALFDDRDVRDFLSHRLVGRTAKKRTIRGAFEGNVHAHVLDLLLLLVDRGRTSLLGEIEEELARLARLARGVRNVTLTSAFPLDSAEASRVTRALEERLRARVELDVEVRPALIGGVVATSEGREIEFSIEGRLRDLSGRLRAEHPTRGNEHADQP